MIKKIALSVFITCMIFQHMHAQSVAAFTDYANKFRVFDAGTFMQMDYMPPSKYVVGGNYVAFISYGNMLKFYYQQKVYELNEGAFVSNMHASNCLFAYRMDKQLNAVYNGKPYTLTTWCDDFRMSDSIIVYRDGMQQLFYIFYKGEKIPMEDIFTIDRDLFKGMAIGKNMIIYVNSSKQLKIFYRGEFIDINIYSPEMTFASGLDIAAGTNSQNQRFLCIENGTIYDLEDFIPESYQVGDGLVAYVSNDNALKVFYDGKRKLLNNYAPLKYTVTDSIVAWVDDQNFFKVFYNGEIYTLENYDPGNYAISLGSVAYIDQQRRLKLFRSGETKIITIEPIKDFALTGNVLKYVIGLDESKFYYEGQTY